MCNAQKGPFYIFGQCRTRSACAAVQSKWQHFLDDAGWMGHKKLYVRGLRKGFKFYSGAQQAHNTHGSLFEI